MTNFLIVTSPDAFSPTMVQRELARRDHIRDEISNMHAGLRGEAEAAEAERKRRWDELRNEHRQRWSGRSSESRSANISDASGSPEAAQRDGPGRREKWRKRVRVFIPLISFPGRGRPQG